MLNKYPLWKNILLLIFFLLGVIYATPNFFPEQPVLQISPAMDNLSFNREVLRAKINKAMGVAHIFPIAKEYNEKTILLRFNNTDTQMKAKDILSFALGEDYTVAANLLSSVPRWMQMIGATPMKLGLDLRGGVHFTLEVDVNNLMTQRLQGLSRNISTDLQRASIHYIELTSNKDQLRILFPNATNLMRAKTLIGHQFSDFEVAQLPLKSRYELSVTWTADGLSRLRQIALDQTINTLRNRINELGVAEPIIQQQANNRISVDLPGVQDIGRAQQILGGTATIEFHLLDMAHNPYAKSPEGSTLYYYENRPVLLYKEAILTGNSITDASTNFDESGRAAVSISLGGGGESYFHQVTGQNLGKPLAIVYVETKNQEKRIKGKKIYIPHRVERIISIATIQTALPPNFQVTGLTNPQEALNLALLLRAGALPAPIYIVEQRTIGPQLGLENIHKGLISISVGFILAVIFMVIYYGKFGFIADIALGVNLVLLIALLSLLGMTLTMPGMAGIVLTVGMAIDTNVLIFERIREELRNKTSPQASIHAGYDRALRTIIDANITTLIVALVLFGIGTGSIKGFAVTLTIGLFTSMLTGIMLTRALINIWYGGRPLKRLPIGI